MNDKMALEPELSPAQRAIMRATNTRQYNDEAQKALDDALSGVASHARLRTVGEPRGFLADKDARPTRRDK